MTREGSPSIETAAIVNINKEITCEKIRTLQRLYNDHNQLSIKENIGNYMMESFNYNILSQTPYINLSKDFETFNAKNSTKDEDEDNENSITRARKKEENKHNSRCLSQANIFTPVKTKEHIGKNNSLKIFPEYLMTQSNQYYNEKMKKVLRNKKTDNMNYNTNESLCKKNFNSDNKGLSTVRAAQRVDEFIEKQGKKYKGKSNMKNNIGKKVNKYQEIIRINKMNTDYKKMDLTLYSRVLQHFVYPIE